MNIRHPDHFSWSQLEAIEKGEKAYIRYLSEEKYESKEMRFGTYIHEGLQKNRKGKEFDFLRMWIPEPGMREVKVRYVFDGVPVEGSIDAVHDGGPELEIDEYKTGKHPWTAEKAQNHGQVALYMLLWWKITKETPDKANLYWIPTREKEGKICLSYEAPVAFEIRKTPYDLLKMEARLLAGIRKYKEFWSKYDGGILENNHRPASHPARSRVDGRTGKAKNKKRN